MSIYDIENHPQYKRTLQPAAETLSATVLDVAKGELHKTGNRVNDEHASGLKVITDLIAEMYVDSPGHRFSVDMFTGAGKTTSVASLLMVLGAKYDNNSHRARGVLVAVGTKAQADELLNMVLSSPFIQRINSRSPIIGTYHSGQSSTIKTKAEAANVPFVIVTHQRIKMNDWEGFLNHDGRQRFVIWDESLVATKADSIDLRTFLNEAAAFFAHLESMRKLQGEKYLPHHRELVEWIAATKNILLNVSETGTVSLPDRLEWLEPGQEFTLSKFKRWFFEFDKAKTIVSLLNAPTNDLFVNLKTNACWFKVHVPDHFRDILILDASGKVKKLCQYDQRIKHIDIGIQKDWSAVTINIARSYSSRYKMEQGGKDAELQAEIRHLLVRDIPEDKNLVTFTLATKSNAGAIDHQAVVAAIDDRVIAHSLDAAKGTNQFSGEEFAFFYGLPFWDDSVLKANIAGQQRDLSLTAEISNAELREVQLSEQVDRVHQAINRLQCRKSEGLKCQPATVWLFVKNPVEFESMLRLVMPNANFVQYEPRHVQTIEVNEAAVETADRMIAHLKTCGTDRVSMTAIRKACGIEIKGDSDLWKKTIKPMFEDDLSEIGWQKVGRSYEPIPVQ